MNELMAVVGDQSWIYWNTDEENCELAIEELFRTMENNNINVDNVTVTRAELRDKNGITIDEI